MINCTLCDGRGQRYDYVVEAILEKQCTNCDGTGKVPQSNAWRPFEASKEAARAAMRREQVGALGCNLHANCIEAEKKARLPLVHCDDERCEECFGY